MPKVYVTRQIRASVDRVWEVVRDFSSLPRWHSLVAACQIEDGLPAATVGCVRRIELQGGGDAIREMLLGLSDVDRCCTYNILEGPLPVENYRATLRLIEITEDNTALGQWQAEFDAPVDQQEQAASQVTEIFREGLKGLDKLLAE